MRLQSNHASKQIKPELVHILSVLGQRHSLPFGEGRFEVWQLESSWPIIFIRSSLDLEDFEDLINF